MLENIKQAKNWEDRYRFIIQAGKHLPPPSPDELAQMQSIQRLRSGALVYGPFHKMMARFNFKLTAKRAL